jgi:hypothetical protein
MSEHDEVTPLPARSARHPLPKGEGYIPREFRLAANPCE